MTRCLLLAVTLAGVETWANWLGLRWWAVVVLGVVALLLALRARGFIRRRAALRTVEGLRLLHPDDFEAEVGRWLRREGWRVEFRGGTGDGGIDLLARKRGETMAVQCKRYAETAAVSAAQVRDLYGAATALGATSAALVTTGRVSRPAASWCEGLPEGLGIRLFDAETLGRIAAREASFG